MPLKYKLIYFPVTARAEMTRLMFAAAGVEYEDYRIKWEDWQKLKPGRSSFFLELKKQQPFYGIIILYTFNLA